MLFKGAMPYSGNAIRAAATCQPETKAKIHLQWNANFTIFSDKKINKIKDQSAV